MKTTVNNTIIVRGQQIDVLKAKTSQLKVQANKDYKVTFEGLNSVITNFVKLSETSISTLELFSRAEIKPEQLNMKTFKAICIDLKKSGFLPDSIHLIDCLVNTKTNETVYPTDENFEKFKTDSNYKTVSKFLVPKGTNERDYFTKNFVSTVLRAKAEFLLSLKSKAGVNSSKVDTLTKVKNFQNNKKTEKVEKTIQKRTRKIEKQTTTKKVA